MNSQELGKRLKEARLAKKMTQSEVVGNFITRNMLSQIESGSATPSIKTLEYLAGVLEISMASLIPDPERASSETDADRIISAKEAVISKQYEHALELLAGDSDSFSDEVCALRSIAYYECARRASKNGELQKAVDYADKAYQNARSGIYENHERAEECMNLKNEAAQYLSDYYAALVTK